jgi:hypothetical protein
VAASIKHSAAKSGAGYPGLDIAIVSLRDRLQQVAAHSAQLDTNLREDEVGLEDVVAEVEKSSRYGVQFRIGQLMHGHFGDHDYLRYPPTTRQLPW